MSTAQLPTLSQSVSNLKPKVTYQSLLFEDQTSTKEYQRGAN